MSMQMQKSALELLYTVKEAMGYLRVSRSTIDRLLKQEKLHGSKVGRNWRFTEEELKEAMRPVSIAKQGE